MGRGPTRRLAATVFAPHEGTEESSVPTTVPDMHAIAPDESRDELRDAVAAIRLATSILCFDGSSWLDPLPTAERTRIHGVLVSLESAARELSARVGTDADAIKAIAHETARMLAARDATAIAIAEPALTVMPSVLPSAELSAALVRLEVIAAVQAPPRPQLLLDVASDAVIPIDPSTLVSALYAATFGLVRSRPLRRTPWTVAISARDERGPDGQAVVVIELRCEVADDSVARTTAGIGPALPPWLHECVRLTDALGGGLSRGRDGTAEVVRMILPYVERLAASPDEAPANARPLARAG